MIQDYVCEPRGYGATLLQRLVLLVQLTFGSEVQVGVVVVAKNVYQSRVSVLFLHLVKSCVNELQRNTVKILRQIGLEAEHIGGPQRTHTA